LKEAALARPVAFARELTNCQPFEGIQQVDIPRLALRTVNGSRPSSMLMLAIF
jgi:hypothetical protein